MSLTTWLSRLPWGSRRQPRPRRRPAAPRRPCVLRLEVLEDRSLPSVLTVTTLEDSGAGSLRQAILDANADPDQDTITFEVQGTINLSAALPNLSSNIDLQGPGADQLTVRRNTGGNYRIFTVASGATVVLSGLTITGGSIPGWLLEGGGILNNGTLTLSNAAVSGNGATARGGISNHGALTLSNAAVSVNVSYGNGGPQGGGGILNSGTLTLNYSTVGGNSADFDGIGGGILNDGGTLTLNYSTVSGNSAAFSDG